MVDWVCGSLISAAPPHDITAQTLAPNESLLCRFGLQITSFTQDGSSRTEMHSLHFSMVEGSVVHLFFTVYGGTMKSLCRLIGCLHETGSLYKKPIGFFHRLLDYRKT